MAYIGPVIREVEVQPLVLPKPLRRQAVPRMPMPPVKEPVYVPATPEREENERVHHNE